MSKTKAGLEGVTAGESKICLIDGDVQKLYYGGYNVADLAEHSNFEETVFLLLKGKLPTQAEFDEFQKSLKKHLSLPEEVIDLIKTFPAKTHPMDVLRTVNSFISIYDADASGFDEAGDVEKSLKLIVQAPLIVATYHRVRNGQEPLQPKESLSIAGNFLYLLRGEEPSASDIKNFDICLILHADHGFNASTFTSRVVAGTFSDMYSATTAAIGALKGPLHGGANQKVKNMLLEIGSPDNVDNYVKETLESGNKIFGFGHRVYRTCEDPRAVILRKIASELSEQSGDTKWFDMSQKVYNAMMKIGEEKNKPLYPNVDFYSATVYTLLGVDDELFTPVFAMSRMAGWCAHIMEQHQNNRLIRPTEDYIGERDLEYKSINNR